MHGAIGNSIHLDTTGRPLRFRLHPQRRAWSTWILCCGNGVHDLVLAYLGGDACVNGGAFQKRAAVPDLGRQDVSLLLARSAQGPPSATRAAHLEVCPLTCSLEPSAVGAMVEPTNCQPLPSLHLLAEE